MPPAPSRTVVTIGVFDGVHVGHRAILRHAREVAAASASGAGASGVARVIAITFDRHPQSILRPSSQPPRLLATDEKVRRLRAAGADEVVVLGPTPELLEQSAEDFIGNLVEQHRPLAIIEGEDFRFGKGRRGDPAMLHALGERLGFEAIVRRKLEVTLTNQLVVPVSSSVIRWLVGHGRVVDAARCLGEPFSLTARVVKGDGQARTLGVPTANLDPADYADFILPADGVYAGLASLPGTDTSVPLHPAAISIGTKPTFAGRALTLEAHLLDYTPPKDAFDSLYGQTVTLRFTHWLRDQYAYPSLDPLLAQLKLDVAQTRRLTAPLAA